MLTSLTALLCNVRIISLAYHCSTRRYERVSSSGIKFGARTKNLRNSNRIGILVILSSAGYFPVSSFLTCLVCQWGPPLSFLVSRPFLSFIPSLFYHFSYFSPWWSLSLELSLFRFFSLPFISKLSFSLRERETHTHPYKHTKQHGQHHHHHPLCPLRDPQSQDDGKPLRNLPIMLDCAKSPSGEFSLFSTKVNPLGPLRLCFSMCLG